jgi:hypothetical protein
VNESHIKILTKNDTGETGSHQGGIAVPKGNKDLVKFFPKLDSSEFNPENWINCKDPDGTVWNMRYVYYNGRTFTPKRSTRNEYRITHMTQFLAKWNACSGDSLTFKASGKLGEYEISVQNKDIEDPIIKAPKVVVLRGWNKVC